MGKITACDVCDQRWPDYTFQHRAKRKHFGILDTWTTTYDVCESCFERLVEIVRKKKKGTVWLAK